ncbi:regulatory protein, luxR family [Saccharopolyspora kobensis]|uniref:Regulatory protein, luxR family n=1 Tax=Saccharopolyspora kobensis TaxID=146035 RepID=A0A1H6EL43_9PSEU|nr:helix-turn-helix transcriptional regulator [Saccharopolyspora kobensis]SEG98558.1 regulatory protein, luxR family [Saccharopolyspora kobensis]SFF28562.1 regulatory protein, luxR family [Saccharopolyspora kobensis]
MLHRCRALLGEIEPEMPGAELLNHPFERARGALQFGQWLRRNRQPARARDALQPSIPLFDEVGARPWAELARSELRACGGSAAGNTAEALTAQEREVAVLAARGLTNREIATRLFISHRTVGHHLQKVFRKLGIPSRAGLRDIDLVRLDP